MTKTAIANLVMLGALIATLGVLGFMYINHDSTGMSGTSVSPRADIDEFRNAQMRYLSGIAQLTELTPLSKRHREFGDGREGDIAFYDNVCGGSIIVINYPDVVEYRFSIVVEFGFEREFEVWQLAIVHLKDGRWQCFTAFSHSSLDSLFISAAKNVHKLTVP